MGYLLLIITVLILTTAKVAAVSDDGNGDETENTRDIDKFPLRCHTQMSQGDGRHEN